MCRWRFLFLLLCFFCTKKWMQQHEIGGMAGVSYYTGDLNTVPFKSSRENLQFFYRWITPAERWVFRGNLSYVHLAGEDAKANNDFQQQRNLAFDTKLIQGMLLTEFHFLPFSTFKNSFNYPFTPYLTFGISLFYFMPYGTTYLGWEDLYALDPEYSNFKKLAFDIPVGVGLKFRIIEQLGLGLEYMLHVPITEYLDGVSLRGSRQKDLFYTLAVQFFYTFPTKNKACYCL